MIRYYNFTQRSKIWYTYRKGKWTGSTAIDLLKGKKAPPENDSDYDNKYMQRGRILEPLAIEAYEKYVDMLGSVKHYGFITNSKYKHAGYSPDGIEPDTLVEVKCVNVDKHTAIGTRNMPIPVEWQAQMHFGIVITELHKLRLILYNPDAETPLFILDYAVDQVILANLVERLKKTEPKRKPSQMRAAKRYLENNPDKVRESNRKRYLKSKKR